MNFDADEGPGVFSISTTRECGKVNTYLGSYTLYKYRMEPALQFTRKQSDMSKFAKPTMPEREQLVCSLRSCHTPRLSMTPDYQYIDLLERLLFCRQLLLLLMHVPLHS
jgi:hypothetical protein